MCHTFYVSILLAAFSINGICSGLDSVSFDRNQVIEDPSISDRCKEMLQERQKKISNKERLKLLEKRANKVISSSKLTSRANISSEVEGTLIKIKREQELTILKIKTLEEKIVRRGCPGIVL